MFKLRNLVPSIPGLNFAHWLLDQGHFTSLLYELTERVGCNECYRMSRRWVCVTRELLMSPAELPVSDIRTFTRYGARMLQFSPTSAVRKDSPGNGCLHWYVITDLLNYSL